MIGCRSNSEATAGPEGSRLPDAVFSFRCGDPQYAYWLDRLQQRPASL
jgi:hypothetical protein